MIAFLLSEAGRAAAALAAAVVPPAHAQDAPVVVHQETAAPVAEPFVWEPLPDEKRCLDRWRSRYWIAQALDLGTTVAAIESGRGREANPLYTAIFGKNVKSWQVAAVKGVSIAATQAGMRSLMRDGEFFTACKAYRINAFVLGGTAMLNLRVLF